MKIPFLKTPHRTVSLFVALVITTAVGATFYGLGTLILADDSEWYQIACGACLVFFIAAAFGHFCLQSFTGPSLGVVFEMMTWRADKNVVYLMFRVGEDSPKVIRLTTDAYDFSILFETEVEKHGNVFFIREPDNPRILLKWCHFQEKARV
jgi:hypothetical protein